MEGDEAGALELEDAEAMLGGLCKEGFVRSRTMSLSRAMWRRLRVALRARRRRMAPPAHPQPPLTHWIREHAWPGPAVPAPRAAEPHNFTLRVFEKIAVHVKKRRWAAQRANPKHGRCFLMRSGKSCAGRPLGLMAQWVWCCSQSLKQEHVDAPPCDARVSARLPLKSELAGPALAALVL